MKPRIHDTLVQTCVETTCFATGQSTIPEIRKAYEEWLEDHDNRIAYEAWRLGFATSEAMEYGEHGPFDLAGQQRLATDYAKGTDAYNPYAPYDTDEDEE